MSSVWAPGRSRNRVRGLCSGSERLGPGCPLLASVQGPAGALVQCRLGREFSSGRPTARGWGCTGQGLCVLHEPRTFVEYTRLSASSTRGSCSARQAPPQRPSATPSATRPSDPGARAACPPLCLRCHDPRTRHKPGNNTEADNGVLEALAS